MLYIRVASKRDAGTDPASYFDRLIGFDHNDPKGEKADRVSFFWYGKMLMMKIRSALCMQKYINLQSNAQIISQSSRNVTLNSGPTTDLNIGFLAF
jgi:hypothetical protein